MLKNYDSLKINELILGLPELHETKPYVWTIFNEKKVKSWTVNVPCILHGHNYEK